MKLMIYTPALRHEDPIFGFSVRWVKEFAKQAGPVVAMSRFVDQLDVPEGSIGVELGKPWVPRVWKLWVAAIKYRKQYDAVFVHMSSEVVVACGWLWWLLGKPVFLWYAHGAIPMSLRIAEKFVKLVFASSSTGLKLKTSKSRLVGQGIDTELFRPDPEIKRDNIFVTVSRITPAKKYEETLEILADYKKRYSEDVWRYEIIGPTLGEEAYVEFLKKKAEELGLADRFVIKPPMINTELPRVYQGAAAFLSTSQTGSIDKVVIEALACGLPVFAKGAGYLQLGGVIDLNDWDTSVVRLHEQLNNPISSQTARDEVTANHGLARLVRVIVGEMKNYV